MQLPSPPSTVTSGPTTQPSPPSQIAQQQAQPDMFLQLLQGPVVSVQVGSGRNTARYNLPAALFCYHSHLFRQEISHQKAVRAQLRANKKRKLSSDGETSTRIKAEDSESEMRTYSSDGGQCTEDDAVLKLLGVDPFIFGLFLKLVYTGYYPAAVDARPEATRPMAQVNKTLQPDTPYTPARASMPPPANINSQQGLPGGPLPYLPVLSSKISTISLEDSSHQVQIPPSVHAYMLSVQLGAPAFLNRAINHIYYGIGKHFILGPSLVHYIWSDTLPHPLCSPSPLRKLILDVMAVHWSSTTTHITAKQPVLHRLWNELLDLHRDLRHGFTMGLQAPVRGEFKELDVQVVNTEAKDNYSTVIAAATAASKELEIGKDEKKERSVQLFADFEFSHEGEVMGSDHRLGKDRPSQAQEGRCGVHDVEESII